jgi:hypothetical protein
VCAPADRTAAAASSSRRRTIVPPPLDELCRVPSFAPFGPRLTSHVPSSSCRTRRCPPRPPKLRRYHGTSSRQTIFSAPPPSVVFGENPAAPPCPAPPPSLPHGVPAGRATPRPSAKPRWPRHRTERVPQRLLAWAGWATVPLGPGQQCWASGRNAGLALCGDFPIFNFHLIF